MRIALLLILQVLVFGLVGSAQSTTKPPKPITGDSWGEVQDGRFSSPRVGIKMAIPTEYTIISTAVAELLAGAGADLLKQGESSKKIDTALGNTIRLLVIAEHPLGTSGNPSLEMVAVKQQPGVTAKMSLTANIMLLKGTPLVLKKSLGTVRLGTNAFEAADLEGLFSGVALKQRMYVILQKGYSVMIVVTYSKDQEIVKMEKIISTLSLLK